MVVTVTVPGDLLPEMEKWMATQITNDGNYYKYADVQDLIQQNFNDSLGKFFADKINAAAVAALQAQLDLAKSSGTVVFPKADPVPVKK